MCSLSDKISAPDMIRFYHKFRKVVFTYDDHPAILCATGKAQAAESDAESSGAFLCPGMRPFSGGLRFQRRQSAKQSSAACHGSYLRLHRLVFRAGSRRRRIGISDILGRGCRTAMPFLAHGRSFDSFAAGRSPDHRAIPSAPAGIGWADRIFLRCDFSDVDGRYHTGRSLFDPCGIGNKFLLAVYPSTPGTKSHSGLADLRTFGTCSCPDRSHPATESGDCRRRCAFRGGRIPRSGADRPCSRPCLHYTGIHDRCSVRQLSDSVSSPVSQVDGRCRSYTYLFAGNAVKPAI